MSELIERQAVIDLWNKYHPTIAVDAMQYDAELRQLPHAQPEPCEDGTLWITIPDINKVERVIVDKRKSKFCKTFYQDACYENEQQMIMREGHKEMEKSKQILKDLQSSVQPEQFDTIKYHEIGYRECADAVLKMWMDNVLTDGEYNRIIDKLNAKWAIAEGDVE